MHKLESDHAKEEVANNALAKFKEHDLEPAAPAKTEFQSFAKLDYAEELQGKKARETNRFKIEGKTVKG